jgi:hypothetical protein
MKMYDNPFLIPTTIGYQDHWRKGISSETDRSSIKQSDGWKPELRHKQPYGSKWETPEGEASAQNCG